MEWGRSEPTMDRRLCIPPCVGRWPHGGRPPPWGHTCNLAGCIVRERVTMRHWIRTPGMPEITGGDARHRNPNATSLWQPGARSEHCHVTASPGWDGKQTYRSPPPWLPRSSPQWAQARPPSPPGPGARVPVGTWGGMTSQRQEWSVGSSASTIELMMHQALLTASSCPPLASLGWPSAQSRSCTRLEGNTSGETQWSHMSFTVRR